MKTITAALVLTTLAAGCVSGTPVERQQMADMDPRVTYATSTSPADTLDCIQTGVEAVTRSGHTVATMEDEEALILWVTVFANPVIAVRIEPAREGSAVEYRSRFKGGTAHYTTAVLACRQHRVED